jgi:hypothetical protein
VEIMRVFAAVVAVLWLALVLAAPAMAQDGGGLRCPEGGLVGAVCQAISPIVGLVLQLAGAAISIMIIIWLIRLIH